jgi:DNA-binding HxlR family transcriptional regulator
LSNKIKKNNNENYINLLKVIAISNEDIFKVLSNRNRIFILYELMKKKSSWSELMFELKITPKPLKLHLDVLKKNNLVYKDNHKKYSLTDRGTSVCQLKFLKEDLEFAKDIAGELEQSFSYSDTR